MPLVGTDRLKGSRPAARLRVRMAGARNAPQHRWQSSVRALPLPPRHPPDGLKRRRCPDPPATAASGATQMTAEALGTRERFSVPNTTPPPSCVVPDQLLTGASPGVSERPITTAADLSGGAQPNSAATPEILTEQSWRRRQGDAILLCSNRASDREPVDERAGTRHWQRSGFDRSHLVGA